MEWEVEYTEEFEVWWNSLTEDEQEDVDASVRLLQPLDRISPGRTRTR
jgi:hypothetical protein